MSFIITNTVDKIMDIILFKTFVRGERRKFIMEVKSDRNLDCNMISEDSGIEVTDAEDGLIIGLGIHAA